MNNSSWVIRIDYKVNNVTRSTYVLDKYSRADGRTLIVPDKMHAQRFVTKKAAESWFGSIRKHWRMSCPYDLVAEEV